MKHIRFSRKLALGFLLVLLAAMLVGAWMFSSGRMAETVTAQRHVAVTANPHASEAARAMLRAGGSAVDASIAAQLVLTLVEPQSSGIGGGLFMLISDPERGMRVFDGREVAPAKASPEMFLDSSGKPRSIEDISTGGLSVGVPGAIAALWAAHQQYGRLPWPALFAPAIALAEHGYVVTPLLGLAIAELKLEDLDTAMRDVYFHPDGKPRRMGDMIRDVAFARTLRLISEQGPSGFYRGPVAEAIVAAVRTARRNPGLMSLEDLANYRSIEAEPLCGSYRLYRICTTPPPSGGLTVLQIMTILEGMAAQDLSARSWSQAHLFTQASRLAYADRARWLGDPEFVSVPIAGLLDKGYLASRGKTISPSRDMGQVEAGSPPTKGARADFAPQRTPVGHGTSHLAIVDDRGMVVSMTMSIQASFGAQLRAAGMVLNNELTDFSTEPEITGRPVANAPAPGKRPLSAMSPSIVLDANGGFFAAIGSPGGPDIIAYNARALSDLLDGNVTMAEAVSNPHVVNTNGTTALEKRLASLILAPGLWVRGHAVRFRELESGLTGIRRVGDRYEAAADIRGEGGARGD